MNLFETKDSLIRTLRTWNDQTFQEAASELNVSNDDLNAYILLLTVLDKQSLMDKPMNGYASEHLMKDEFEDMGVTYVDFFNKLSESDEFWTPTHVLYEVCKNNIARRSFYEKKAVKYNTTFEMIACMMCGRALRALPSYIREPQLLYEMKDTFHRARFEKSDVLDKKFHCDIKMTMKDQNYYVWSFMATNKSMCKFIEKFTNQRRGSVANGYHLLCPFDKTDNAKAQYLGWGLYSKEYINEIQTAVFQKTPVAYVDVMQELLTKPKVFKRPTMIQK